MKRFFTILMFFMLLIAPLDAQDDLPDFPPDPTELFDARLTVVDIQIIPPSPVADTDSQQIYVFNVVTGEWQSFPFPTELPNPPSIKAWEDNTYLVYSYDLGAWILNTEDNTYTEIPFVCDSYAPAPPGDGEWYPVIEWNDISTGDIATMRLCFTETGEITAPLTAEIDWFHCCGALTMSPTGEWLILIATEGEIIVQSEVYGPTTYVYYAYEISTGHLHRLGDLPTGMDISVPHISGWVDDTHGIIYDMSPGESSSDDFYTFDITEPDSFELFLHGWLLRSSWAYIDYNRSYQLLETTAQRAFITGSRVEPHQPCTLYIYDRYGIRQFELGYDCLGAHFFYADNAYYTIRADITSSETSTLIRMESLTGEITELFTGEIEGFIQLSPDGRYATLLMDNNGEVDRVNYFFDGAIGAVSDHGLEEPYYVRVDLETEGAVEIIADIERYSYTMQNPFAYLFYTTNDNYIVHSSQIAETTFSVRATPRNYDGYSPPHAIYALEYQSE